MFKDWYFQTYWQGWYSLPWWSISGEDEHGIKALWFGVGPFQFRKTIRRK